MSRNRTVSSMQTATGLLRTATLLICVATGPLAIATSAALAHPPGWTTQATSGVGPSERSRPAVAALGRYIYLFGGIFDDFSSSEFVFLNDLYRFDTRSNHWEALTPDGPTPEARGFAGHATVRAERGFAVFGGGQYEADLSVTIFGDLWLYTPRDNRWAQIVPENAGPPPRFDPKVWSDGDVLYVFGGLDESFGVNNDLWAYSFTSNRWRLVTANGDAGSPEARANAMGPDRAHRGKLFLYGGEGAADVGFPILGDVWQFDVASASWQEITPQPDSQLAPRNHMSVVWLDRALYLYGGDVSGGSVGCGAPFPQNPIGELWRFDPRTNEWRQADDVHAPGPLKRHVAAVVGRTMYLLDGYDFAVTGDESEPCQVWNLDVHTYRPPRFRLK